MTQIPLYGALYQTAKRFRDWMNTSKVSQDRVSNHLDALVTPDGVRSGSHAVATQAAVTLLLSGVVTYSIGGVMYTKDLAAATVTLEDLGDILQNKFGAWRLEIDKLGAVTAKASPTVGGETTAQKALLSLASIAPTAATATIAYATVTETDAAFNIGTDNTNKASTTFTFYYERQPRKRITGLNAARGAVSSLNAGAVTVNSGTIDANVNGLKKAQIAAAATQALTDADTITTLTYGAVLLCTDLAGTGVVSLNAAGTPGVTAMAYATAAAAKAALDLVVDRLPGMFCPISYITVSNQSVSTFTFKTTFWDATSITSAIVDASLGTWDRTAPTGFDSHQISRPVIPAVQDTFTGP